ncbi:ankyrin repeat domain-containing protein, partial [candidate division KSB1 bacterium]|nr:ankyrin repeat domain-containing protein [candidate division KSB1 bacterium]
IYYAAYHGSVRTLELLIEHEVDINQRIPEGTLLHLAAERDHPAVVSLLLEKGVRLDKRNSKGKTALEVAL